MCMYVRTFVLTYVHVYPGVRLYLSIMLHCRHPSNLMLDRLTGRVLHIDFGDCFEVAMIREKFPEKIPFRLTRMLTNAMEVSLVFLQQSCHPKT